MSNLIVKRNAGGDWERGEQTPGNGMSYGISWDMIVQYLRDRDHLKLREDEDISHFVVDPLYGVQARIVKK